MGHRSTWRRLILDGFVVVIFGMVFAEMIDFGLNVFSVMGLFILGFILSTALVKNNIQTLGQFLFQPHLTATRQSWFKRFWFWQLIVFFIFLLGMGFHKTEFSLNELLNEDGFNGMKRLFKGIFSPNWDVFPKAVVNIIETLFMAFMATLMAIPFAFVLSFLAAKNVMTSKLGYAIYLLTRTLFNLTRSIEVLLWAIIFSVWVGIGPFAGMLALMIHSIASLAKQYSEMIESVNEGPIEAIRATGANPLQTIWFGIVPQVILPFISFTVYRWDINVRMATIIGLVGGGGIGTMLIQYQGQAMWAEVGTIIIVIAAVVWMIDQASAHIREALK